jgi:hypothetical protein
VDGKAIGGPANDGCEIVCRDFLREELPELAEAHLARYLASLIDRDHAHDVHITEGPSFQCVHTCSNGKACSVVAVCMNLSRNSIAKAVDMLKASEAQERTLVYLYSFNKVTSEDGITEAVMEAEMLRLVRDSEIVAFFAVLDGRAGMGMMARIDGDRRTIEYLPY